MCLLLLAAGWFGWESTRPKIEFSDLPPADIRRVHAARDRIDPNTASEASMLRLGGIGPSRARSIVEYRRARGPDAFKTAADLAAIKGIGPGTIHRIAPDLSLPK